jgi:hypothetical protein
MLERIVWASKHGRTPGPSHCRYCYHYGAKGWVKGRGPAFGCLIQYSVDVPDVTDCREYVREPGSDDE